MGGVEQNGPNHTPLLSASLRWWERQATKNMAGRSLEKGLEEREGRRWRRRERRAVPAMMREVLWAKGRCLRLRAACGREVRGVEELGK